MSFPLQTVSLSPPLTEENSYQVLCISLEILFAHLFHTNSQNLLFSETSYNSF